MHTLRVVPADTTRSPRLGTARPLAESATGSASRRSPAETPCTADGERRSTTPWSHVHPSPATSVPNLPPSAQAQRFLCRAGCHEQGKDGQEQACPCESAKPSCWQSVGTTHCRRIIRRNSIAHLHFDYAPDFSYRSSRPLVGAAAGPSGRVAGSGSTSTPQRGQRVQWPLSGRRHSEQRLLSEVWHSGQRM